MRPDFDRVYKEVADHRTSSIEFMFCGETYIRRFAPAERLILLGGGNVSQALCPYAADLGFKVTVVDDRPSFANKTVFAQAAEIICDEFGNAIERLSVSEDDYVAVLTRGHRYDALCVKKLLCGKMPRYFGMIGSKRRVAGLFESLRGEGFRDDQIRQIHAPIGLPIKALTVKEIAISIVAELIEERRKDTPRHSGSTTLTEDGTDIGFIRNVATDRTPKALMMVLETEGSTPVKSGAMMIVDENLRTAGTIGGGCSEHQVMTEARKIIGTGEQKISEVNLCADFAEEDGMVCGGKMRVLIMDISYE